MPGPSLRLGGLVALLASGSAVGQDAPLALHERFTPGAAYRVTLESKLTGRLAVPQPDKKTPDVLPFVGQSTLDYDERPLAPTDDGTARVVRNYRKVEFARTIGDRPQTAEVRAAVRRMVVLRGAKGKKVPFSPDGPLTLGEIEVVRIDVFSPVLVTGLLPANPVKPGDKWPAADAAVVELTDYDAVESNALTVEFVAVVNLNGRRLAKLALAGAVAGSTEDGPSRQAITGTAYFDLDDQRLSYLKINGKSQLLGPKGVTAGEVAGTFTLTRAKADAPAGLTPDDLKAVDLLPTAANSLLLYDDPSTGVRFDYPRRWRVGVTAGRQLAIDEATGQAGLLLTTTPPDKTPTAAAYLVEVKGFGIKQGWTVTGETAPARAAGDPAVDRFTLDVTSKGEKLRLPYAVVTTPAGGATVAARVVAGPQAAVLEADIDGIVRSLRLAKPVE